MLHPEHRDSRSILEICLEELAQQQSICSVATPKGSLCDHRAFPVAESSFIACSRVADVMKDRLKRLGRGLLAARVCGSRSSKKKRVQFDSIVKSRVFEKVPARERSICWYSNDDFAEAARVEIERRRRLGVTSLGCITSTAFAHQECPQEGHATRLLRSASSLSSSPSLKGGRQWSDHFQDDDSWPLE